MFVAEPDLNLVFPFPSQLVAFAQKFLITINYNKIVSF